MSIFATIFYISASLLIWLCLIIGGIIFYKIGRLKHDIKQAGLGLVSKVLSFGKGGEDNDSRK